MKDNNLDDYTYVYNQENKNQSISNNVVVLKKQKETGSPDLIKEKLLKKLKRKYWDKNEGWENGYMEECILKAIEETSKAKDEEFIKILDELRRILISRMCTPNKPVNTFQNAREQKETINEEFKEKLNNYVGMVLKEDMVKEILGEKGK